MSQINTREICLLGPATQTTTGTGPDINLIQGWQSAIISATVLTVSGTSPTLDIFVQKKIGQALVGTDTSGSFLTGTAVYDDLLHFTQFTTTGTVPRIANLTTGELASSANSTVITTVDYLNSVNASGANALAAGSARVGPLGGLWRISWTVGGTSPSFAFFVQCTLIPFST
jgi:hypothetical protein